MIHVLVVEDDARVAELLERVLQLQNFLVTVAYDGSSGYKLALAHDYQLLITDIILPQLDGLRLCQQVRAAKPNLPILMLTALGTTDDKVEGFDAGADDYLVKPFEIRELLVRIRALLKRHATAQVAGSVLRFADLELNTLTKLVRRQEREIRLTPKEFNLLEYLMRNPNRVLMRAEIASEVWNTQFDTGSNFIDVYINYLRKKVDRDFDHKLIHTRPGMGFILTSDK